MNYRDFGVTCAEELEQDEWSLSRPTFETPKGGVLTIVGWKGKKYSNKTYVAKCSLCSLDTELFGDGVFSATKAVMKRSSVCGCGVMYKKSKSQYEVLSKRVCTERGIIFNNLCGEFCGSKTKVSLSCTLHGEWRSCDVDHFLRGRGCPKCASEKLIRAGAESVRIGFDEFVRRAVSIHGVKYEYLHDKFKTASQKVGIACPIHGLFMQWGPHHLQGGGCPKCSVGSQCQAYIHKVSSGDSGAVLKIGITKNWKTRIVSLRKGSCFKIENLGVWGFKTPDECRNAELECKQTLNTGVLTAREMKDGWTETVSVLDLEKVIAIYEKHGGKRIK